METTIVKGLRVLEAMSQNPELIALTGLAKECGISKSNVHRLLQTLEYCGYVFRDPTTRTYRPTLRQWEMGQRVYDRMSLPAIAGRHLAQLSAATEETVHLSVFDNDQVLYVDKAESSHSVRTYVSAGEREPAYCTCSGKAMLAYMPRDIIQRIAGQMTQFTDQTVKSATELDRQLSEVRQQGFAVTSGEYRSGVLGFARAIRSRTDRVIGAIGIAGPTERMQKFDTDRYVNALIEAVTAVEQDLGFTEPAALAQTMA